MTAKEAQELLHSQADGHLSTGNDHGINLGQVLVPPQKISVIVRTVRHGDVTDTRQPVWLVGREIAADGYRIVMREDGLQFGLASIGFPSDEHPILTGWYGDLVSTFLSM